MSCFTIPREASSSLPFISHCSGSIKVPSDSPKAGLGIKRLKRGCSSKDLLITPEQEACILALREALADRTSRHELIQALLACESDSTLKIRFCTAVEELSTINDLVERNAKGNKIISMFVRNGSMFQCQGIPKAVQNETQWKSFEMLYLLRNQFELDIVQENEIQDALRKMDKNAAN